MIFWELDFSWFYHPIVNGSFLISIIQKFTLSRNKVWNLPWTLLFAAIARANSKKKNLEINTRKNAPKNQKIKKALNAHFAKSKAKRNICKLMTHSELIKRTSIVVQRNSNVLIVVPKLYMGGTTKNTLPKCAKVN